MTLVRPERWWLRHSFAPTELASVAVVRHWYEYRYWLILDGALIGVAILFWIATGSVLNILSPAVAGVITGVTGTVVGAVNVLRYRVVLRNYRTPRIGDDTASRASIGDYLTSAFLQKKFKVALSFPGEKRWYVARVARGLRDAGVEVFYDGFYEAELAQLDLDLVLQEVYHKNSELIVVFLCEEYQAKEWCGVEWRAIRDLIKRRLSSIMLIRFDDAEVPGVFSIDGYLDARDRAPDSVVEAICRRIA